MTKIIDYVIKVMPQPLFFYMQSKSNFPTVSGCNHTYYVGSAGALVAKAYMHIYTSTAVRLSGYEYVPCIPLLYQVSPSPTYTPALTNHQSPLVG